MSTLKMWVLCDLLTHWSIIPMIINEQFHSSHINYLSQRHYVTFFYLHHIDTFFSR